jgi:toxin-antitoxin system PIN domain toxin
MSVLLDANALGALLVAEHVRHELAESWFATSGQNIATCPITQGSLIRLMIREGQSGPSANSVLEALAASDRHEFWPDDLPYASVRMTGVVGHRQVTDAYLAQLARSHQGRLATFDGGLAALHGDVADLIPIN